MIVIDQQGLSRDNAVDIFYDFILYFSVNFALEKIRCNATALILSWNLGNIFDENITLQVEEF